MNNTDFQTIILAAGKGNRMNHPELPKVLIPLHNKPLVSYILRTTDNLHLKHKTVIVVGHKKELVEEMFGSTYAYAHQAQQLGTGDAVKAAEQHITAQHVLVLYGDMPLIRTESLQKLITVHASTHATVSMLSANVPNYDGVFETLLHYGRIMRSGQTGTVSEIVEFRDCTPEQQAITEVNPGIYCFDASWLWPKLRGLSNHNDQGEYYLTDVIQAAVAEGQLIRTIRVNPEEVVGINTPEDLELVSKLI